jgi:Collagen triple helix repeat (20 copies)
MRSRLVGHIRGNIVGYVALFAALGGTSYAAVTLAPGSVTTRALANGAVTSIKLGRNSVGAKNIRPHSLTQAAFTASALQGLLGKNGVNGIGGVNGTNGSQGSLGAQGAPGPTGPMGPAGHDGSASLAATATESVGSVTAPHGASTNVPLTGGNWTQAGGDLDLIAGSMTVEIPASCTGSFGNSLVVSVDGTPNTFALAPTAPASGTETVPFLVSELTQPGSDAHHTVTAALANTCSKSGEDYTVSNAKVDVVNFH